MSAIDNIVTSSLDKKLSPTALSILTLLNNINELIVVSNDREGASDVMRALTIYAGNSNYKLPQEKIENFHAVLLDSRPITLSYIIHDIASEIFSKDK